MAKYRIKYAIAAMDDLDAIFDYIAVEDREAAIKLLENIDRAVNHLSEAPYIRMALQSDEFGVMAMGYRYIVVSPYLVFYRILGNEVRVGRVLHGRRDWMQLLFNR